MFGEQDISIGGKNPINISFARIGNQVIFLDTIKYFQQSLASFANSFIDENNTIRKECRKFISKDESLLRKFNKCPEKDQEWILDYLLSGKGVVPYEMNTTFDLLNISPQKGEFFLIIFIQTLKVVLFQQKITITLKNFWEMMDFE